MKSFDLNVKIAAEENAYSMIELSGFLDAHTVNSFEGRLEDLLEEGRCKMVIDLQDLNYISSAGIGALMAMTQKLRNNGGDLILFRPNEKVYKILDLLGFTKIFNVATDEQDLKKQLD